jgi:CheY-like chemotaxis protein
MVLREKEAAPMLNSSLDHPELAADFGPLLHKLNNLLQVIHGFSQCALKATSPDHASREDLQRVLTAATEAIQVAGQMRDLRLPSDLPVGMARPAVESAPPRQAASVHSARPVSRPNGLTVLVVEDDDLVRRLAVRLLNGAGYTTLAAQDGEEAVKLFEQRADAISLVLLDTQVPKLDCRQVYRRIREQRPDVPVLLCTGEEREAAEIGGDAPWRLMRKPYTPPVFLSTVRAAIG